MTRRRELVARLDDTRAELHQRTGQLHDTRRQRDFLAGRVAHLERDLATTEAVARTQLARCAELAASRPVVVIDMDGVRGLELGR